MDKLLETLQEVSEQNELLQAELLRLRHNYIVDKQILEQITECQDFDRRDLTVGMKKQRIKNEFEKRNSNHDRSGPDSRVRARPGAHDDQLRFCRDRFERLGQRRENH